MELIQLSTGIPYTEASPNMASAQDLDCLGSEWSCSFSGSSLSMPRQEKIKFPNDWVQGVHWAREIRNPTVDVGGRPHHPEASREPHFWDVANFGLCSFFLLSFRKHATFESSRAANML